jgi:hypothetical protein
MAEIETDPERAMLLEDYNDLPDSAHSARLHWTNGRGDYQPIVINGVRTIPGKTDERY